MLNLSVPWILSAMICLGLVNLIVALQSVVTGHPELLSLPHNRVVVWVSLLSHFSFKPADFVLILFDIPATLTIKYF